MSWDVLDFAVLAGLLAGVGGTFWLARRMTDNVAYRAGVGIALLAAFLLVWVNGAVGIIGSSSNDANLMFFGVLAVGIISAIFAGFQPVGMVRAMLATAIAQVAVAVIAVTAGLGSSGPRWPADVLVLTVFFAALWLLSAWMFQKAAQDQVPSAAEPQA
ncbi:MAG: hypothetical protein EX272_13635 [Chromatiales bacterium]|nr:MAG: hypothetical protein EX272_13635 [Chromatiales bacterium]